MSDAKNSSAKPGEPRLWQPQAGLVEGEGARVDDGTRPRGEERPKEYGGRDGLDPTRYGDWEKNGRCIDF